MTRTMDEHQNHGNPAHAPRVAPLVFAALLLLAGVLSVWLKFPVSAPLRGIEVPSAGLGTTLPLAWLVLGVFLLAIMAAIPRRWGLAALATVAAWVLLMLFPLQLMSVDPQWIDLYMRESLQRANIQAYLGSYLLNVGLEPTILYISDFLALDSRLELVLSVLGWGWSLAVLGLALWSLGLAARMSPLARVVFLLAIPVLVCASLALRAVPMLHAESLRTQGDTLLAQGRHAEALRMYTEALRQDRVLSLSRPFIQSISRAHFLLHGEQDPYALLYRLTDLLAGDPPGALDLLASSRPTSMARTPYREAMRAQLLREEVEIEVQLSATLLRGLSYAQAGMYLERAFAGAPEALHVRLMLAKLRMDQKDYVAALEVLEPMPARVYHVTVQADIYSLMGDCYERLGESVKARDAYFAAYELDNKENYRVFKALSGT